MNTTYYYLCNYRPRSVGSDQLSESLIRFKVANGLTLRHGQSVHYWILPKSVFGENPQIIRALGSEETKATVSSRTAMDRFGKRLEKKGVGLYFPGKLFKVKTTRSIQGLSSPHILILDDILTTAPTMKVIIKAISQVLPACKISLFT